MAADPHRDVHFKVGLSFIVGCVLVGFLASATIVVAGAAGGWVHVARSQTGVRALNLFDILLIGLIGAGNGLFNGVLLALGKKLWPVGLLIGAVPMGIFGLRAAEATHHADVQDATAIVFWVIPILITALCFWLRHEVWKRHAKPVVGRSTGAR